MQIMSLASECVSVCMRICPCVCTLRLLAPHKGDARSLQTLESSLVDRTKVPWSCVWNSTSQRSTIAVTFLRIAGRWVRNQQPQNVLTRIDLCQAVPSAMTWWKCVIMASGSYEYSPLCIVGGPAKFAIVEHSCDMFFVCSERSIADRWSSDRWSLHVWGNDTHLM